MHVAIPIAEAVPGAGILVAEDADRLETAINALLAAMAAENPSSCVADASITAVEGGRLFMASLTFDLDGPASPALPACSALTCRIFRGELDRDLRARRSYEYPLPAFPVTLYLDKIAAGSNGREFWNLQLFAPAPA